MIRAFKYLVLVLTLFGSVALAGCGALASAAGGHYNETGIVADFQVTTPDNPGTPRIEVSCVFTLQPDKRGTTQYKYAVHTNISVCKWGELAKGKKYEYRKDDFYFQYTVDVTVDSVTPPPDPRSNTCVLANSDTDGDGLTDDMQVGQCPAAPQDPQCIVVYKEADGMSYDKDVPLADCRTLGVGQATTLTEWVSA